MIVTLRANQDSRESISVAIAALTIVAVWVVLVLRGDTQVESGTLAPHQASGFQTLNAVEQGLYADLEIAGREIDALHDADEGTWPAIAALQAEYLPPFVNDAAWARRGRPNWFHVSRTTAALHAAVYAGISADPAAAASFLLFLEHGHEDDAAAAGMPAEEHFQIWYHAGAAARVPSQMAEPGFIRNGWREIVPYRGGQELQRLDRGKTGK